MKRFVNHFCGLLALVFICLALTSRPTGNFQGDTSTAITEQLNQKAIKRGLPMNYFRVQSIAFLTENNKQIADQQQKELTFEFIYEILETNELYKEGDLISGKGKALFVTDYRDQWHLHQVSVE